ncbi:hypothetical protein PCASD_15777 [Puccinia coronata f. sp. avenae]|uniref:Uncharacterized protein n=1 Tax=Puccinia coronata f. sp. avenae TaxID=200324 RepID=A0A2N5TX02_9BASI|nr:hypothetical protein PCASD_15777 [Puccinia coronata f. sp. avenae]
MADLKMEAPSSSSNARHASPTHHQVLDPKRCTEPTQPRPLQTSSLTKLTPSQILTRPLTPLLTLAAYGSLIVTAFSALVGLLIASYGLSAWDDAKDKLQGVRGLIGKGLEVGKDIVGAVTSTSCHQPSESSGRRGRTTAPRRTAPHPTYPPRNTPPHSDEPSKYSNQTTGYEVPVEEDEPEEDWKGKRGTHSDWFERSNPSYDPPSAGPAPHEQSTRLPPRPPISVLIASLFLTLIVLTARLLVVWWMGQQAQKNSSHAFRNAQRAYNEAAAHDDHHPTHHHRHRTSPSSSSASSWSPQTHTTHRLSKSTSSFHQ